MLTIDLDPGSPADLEDLRELLLFILAVEFVVVKGAARIAQPNHLKSCRSARDVAEKVVRGINTAGIIVENECADGDGKVRQKPNR